MGYSPQQRHDQQRAKRARRKKEKARRTRRAALAAASRTPAAATPPRSPVPGASPARSSAPAPVSGASSSPPPPSDGRAGASESAHRLLGFLARLTGPLYWQAACANTLSETAARVVAAGGEFLSVVVRSDNPSSCCGRDFLMLATVNPCHEPGQCRSDHLPSPHQVAAIVERVVTAAPDAVKASPGWAEAIAKLSGDRPTVS